MQSRNSREFRNSLDTKDDVRMKWQIFQNYPCKKEYTIWICAATARKWKEQTLVDNLKAPLNKEEIKKYLQRGFDLLESWSEKDLEEKPN